MGCALEECKAEVGAWSVKVVPAIILVASWTPQLHDADVAYVEGYVSAAPAAMPRNSQRARSHCSAETQEHSLTCRGRVQSKACPYFRCRSRRFQIRGEQTMAIARLETSPVEIAFNARISC